MKSFSKPLKLFPAILSYLCVTSWVVAAEPSPTKPIVPSAPPPAVAPLVPPVAEKPVPVPTVITSDRLEVMNNKEKNQNEFHFDGNVKVVGSDLDATADQLIVFADKSASGNSNQVGTMHEMIATGHVNIVQPNRRAISGKAIIYPQTGKMILLESPVVFSKDDKGGESKVTGDRMELYRDDNRAVIIGGPKERPKITLMGEMPSLTSSPTKKAPSETPVKVESTPVKDAPKPPDVSAAAATPVVTAKETKAQ